MNRKRSRLYTILANFSMWILIALMSGSTLAAGPVPKTDVMVFQPSVPGGPSRSGECWTDSIAVARTGVWRCMLGNEIYDPCFSNTDLRDGVICDADPAKNTRGFVVKLTKPLPKPSSNEPPDARPWLVKLEDGSICEIETGTISMVDNIAIPYDCSDSKPCNDSGCPYMTGLAEHFNRGKVWTATKIAYSSDANGLKMLSRKRVSVAAAWK